ncbi:MAG: thioredoxin family protein [Nanoarchaeota archaeon]
MVKEIKVLGSGCPSCVRLENNVKSALEKSGIKAKVTKITEIAKIMEYGVMSTPALVFDEKVVSYGKVNDVNEIIELLKK